MIRCLLISSLVSSKQYVQLDLEVISHEEANKRGAEIIELFRVIYMLFGDVHEIMNFFLEEWEEVNP